MLKLTLEGLKPKCLKIVKSAIFSNWGIKQGGVCFKPGLRTKSRVFQSNLILNFRSEFSRQVGFGFILNTQDQNPTGSATLL